VTASVHRHLSPSGRVVVLTLQGDHDIGTAEELRQALIDSIGLGLTVVDLRGCTFIDSTVLGVIASAARRASSQSAELVLINATGIVAKALSITGMSHVLRWSHVQDGLPGKAKEVLSAAPRQSTDVEDQSA
jgi:anti-anti-sigma factor